MDNKLKLHLDKVADRLLYGVMAHSQMMQYYDFLSLPHYADSHAKHYHEESETYHKYMRMLIGEYNYIYRTEPSAIIPNMIPSGWNKVKTFAINDEDRKKAVVEGLAEWLKWEEDTHETFKEAFEYAYAHGEIFTAEMIRGMLESVSDEIRNIKHYISKRSAIADVEMVEEDKYVEPKTEDANDKGEAV